MRLTERGLVIRSGACCGSTRSVVALAFHDNLGFISDGLDAHVLHYTDTGRPTCRRPPKRRRFSNNVCPQWPLPWEQGQDYEIQREQNYQIPRPVATAWQNLAAGSSYSHGPAAFSCTRDAPNKYRIQFMAHGMEAAFNSKPVHGQIILQNRCNLRGRKGGLEGWNVINTDDTISLLLCKMAITFGDSLKTWPQTFSFFGFSKEGPKLNLTTHSTHGQ